MKMKIKMPVLAGLLLLLTACGAQPPQASATPAPVPTAAPAAVPTAAPETADPNFLGSAELACGTRLVRLEWYENGGESEHVTVRGTVTDSARPDAPPQTFEDTADEYGEGLAFAEDVNFDGETDFYYLRAAGSVNRYYTFWLWDAQAGEFVECPALGDFSLPVFHADTQLVSTHVHDSAETFTDNIYRWQDGGLAALRTLAAEGNQEGRRLLVTDYAQGEPTVLFEAAGPAGGTWDEAIYGEFERFYDLDYRGVPYP